jgi:hypothetical protein
MDINDIYISEGLKEIDLTYKTAEIKLKVKQLSWSKKNQILSACFTYGADSQMKFNFDKYIKDMLCEMIVEAPWGQTNHIFLSKISPEFGAMLEKLVPKAFEEGATNDFFVKEPEVL